MSADTYHAVNALLMYQIVAVGADEGGLHHTPDDPRTVVTIITLCGRMQGISCAGMMWHKVVAYHRLDGIHNDEIIGGHSLCFLQFLQ